MTVAEIIAMVADGGSTILLVYLVWTRLDRLTAAFGVLAEKIAVLCDRAEREPTAPTRLTPPARRRISGDE